MILIVDFYNHDVGLKILFPEADYFILEEEFDRTNINTKYKIEPIIQNKEKKLFEEINPNQYDTVFIIAPLYNCLKQYNNKTNSFFNENFSLKLIETIDFINKNNFKSVCFFDNYDYDYDPNIIFEENFVRIHNVRFFKRYFNKDKLYSDNVSPFPYITFGHQCNIDTVNDLFNKTTDKPAKIPRIFFAGSLLVHIDDVYGIVRNRKEMIIKIASKLNIYNPGHIPHTQFMDELSNSKYCLDLLGVGDPNTRTFEILSSKSLRISQRSNLKWNFDEDFSEETIFDNENDLFQKIIELENNTELYNNCLEKQNQIVTNYMNIPSLRSYIIKHL